MAIFTALTGFNYSNFMHELDSSSDGGILTKTTNKFELWGTYSNMTVSVVMDGSNFVYDQWGLNGGTVSKITYKLNSVIQWTAQPDASWNVANNVYDNGYNGYIGSQAELAFMAKGSDTFNGSASNDIARGFEGDDNIFGNGGTDTLYGDEGNDTLNGGTGADLMWGGAGNDVYYVDNASDQTNEAISATNSADAGGTDLVYSSVTRTLGNYLENLTLTGTAAINGTGNSLANTLTGNSAVNTLSGGAGNDTLNGGLGKDILTGGTGVDYFDFTTALSSTNVDTITDFNRADDSIRLDNAVMAGLGATTGALSAAAFVSGAGRTTAADASDRVIYNTTTGDLYYDADGTGSSAAVKIALIGTSTHPALDHTDFLII
jgi:Ca2+-binding RTX toxin-like protein